MESGKINLNQTLWALAISFAALGASEHFGLCMLYKFSLAACALTTLSYLITLIPYTRRYWLDKWKVREPRNNQGGGSRPMHQRGPHRPPQSTN
jgi:hypothetical protein